MNAEQIMQSPLLDLIFENKNKDYGAYPLRKYYHKRLLTALGMIFLATSLFAIFVYFIGGNEAKIPTVLDDVIYGTVLEIPKDLPKQPLPPTPPKKAIPAAGPKQPDTEQVPIISDKAAVTKHVAVPSVVSLPAGPVSVSGPSGDSLAGPRISPMSPGPTGVSAKPFDKTSPMANPDVMPTYPGGIEALRKFLERNLSNPVHVDAEEIVDVKVKFVVGYDGEVKDFEITEDGGAVFNNEVIRVLKKMKPWIPGKANGENVAVYYSIPVKFTGSN